MPLINQISVPAKQGLQKTIETMNLLQSYSMQNQKFINFVYKKFATQCTPCIPGKIWKYMRDNFQFVSDDPFDELLIAPYLMPEIKKGDCDDFALFAKTCIDLLGGWFSNYILLAKEKNNYTHVAVFVHRGIYNNTFIDCVVVDGANENFNILHESYNFYNLV
jgi:hypothetical protein